MVALPPEVRIWLAENSQGELLQPESVSGGCIHQAYTLRTTHGDSYFLKTNSSSPGGIFAAEAAGLNALQVTDGPTVPRVLLVGEGFLLMEDLRPAPRRSDFWTRYGAQLARIHQQGSSRFGFETDNFIGASPQENDWMDDGIDFFRDRRLRPQIEWGIKNGLLDSTAAQKCESLLNKLGDLLPVMPPVLLHGDLWSGNLITDSDGNPALIDPAVYYGWAEADLAMAELFGSYPDAFYAAYQDVIRLLPGFRGRFPLYNLYHLLNHLNLFGRSYLPGVNETLRRFS